MTYIFLTPELGNMGGSQMFICNKSAFLRSKGWRVIIIYFTDTKIIIDKLNSFEKYCFPELAWGIQYYTQIRVKKTLDKIVDCIENNDSEIVIESSLYHLSFWGELLASRIKAKHILHFLEEEIPTYSNRVAAFMEYKLYRWECMNASEKSLKRLFGTHYKAEYKNFEFKTDFFCSNVTQDGVDEQECNISFEKADDTIFSIGRLDKPYIAEMVNQVIKYANKYSNRKINMVFIGGSSKGKEEVLINNKLSSVSNVKTYLLGYLFPVPSDIIKTADVSIATSNSVLVSYNLGVPTIVVDANDYYAMGLYGVDTMLTVFRKDEKQVPIKDYLEKVLVEKKYSRPTKITKIKSEEEILDEHFKDQLSFIEHSSNDYSYYRIDKLYSIFEVLRGIMVRTFTVLRNGN